MSINPDIGYRFAGYVDGEGHFAITRQTKPNGTPVYGCAFALHIRDDDRHVLERFQNELCGIGTMYEVAARFKPGLFSEPEPDVLVEPSFERSLLNALTLWEGSLDA